LPKFGAAVCPKRKDFTTKTPRHQEEKKKATTETQRVTEERRRGDLSANDTDLHR